MNLSDTEAPEGGTSGVNDGDSGISVPEDFQKEAHALINKATNKHMLNHVSDKVSAKHEELRKAAEPKDVKGKGKVQQFSAEDMPSSY